MKKLIGMMMAIGLVVSVVGCDKDEEFAEYQEVELTPSQSGLVADANDFGLQLLNSIAQENGEVNVVLSPFSAWSELAMLANGDNNQTAQEIRARIAGGASMGDINEFYKLLATKLPTLDSKSELKIANGLWVNQGLTLADGFQNAIKQYYNAGIATENLHLPATLQAINRWIEDHTGGGIKDFYTDGAELGNLAIANALYFKGEWMYKFDNKSTKDEGFYLYDGTKLTAKMMYEGATTLKGNTTDLYEICVVPYGNNNYQMLIILPKSGKKPNDVLPSLTQQTLKAALAEADYVYSSLKMPKFTAESAYNLQSTLNAIGVSKLFDSEFGLDNLLSGKKVSNILVNQKTKIVVDEEGTIASSATSSNEATAPGPVRALVVNRPYIYLVRESSTGLILLAGKVERP